MFRTPAGVKYTHLVNESRNDTAPLSSPPPMSIKLPINNIKNTGTGSLPKNVHSRHLPPLPCSSMESSTNYYTESDSQLVKEHDLLAVISPVKSTPNLSKMNMAALLSTVKSPPALPHEIFQDAKGYTRKPNITQQEIFYPPVIPSASTVNKHNLTQALPYKTPSLTSHSELYKPKLDVKTGAFPAKDLKYGITVDVSQQYEVYYPPVKPSASTVNKHNLTQALPYETPSLTSHSELYKPKLDVKTGAFPAKDLKYGITVDVSQQYEVYYPPVKPSASTVNNHNLTQALPYKTPLPTSNSESYKAQLDFKTGTFPAKDLKYGITVDMAHQYADYYARTQQWEKYHNVMRSLEIHTQHNERWNEVAGKGKIPHQVDDTLYESTNCADK